MHQRQRLHESSTVDGREHVTWSQQGNTRQGQRFHGYNLRTRSTKWNRQVNASKNRNGH